MKVKLYGTKRSFLWHRVDITRGGGAVGGRNRHGHIALAARVCSFNVAFLLGGIFVYFSVSTKSALAS